MLKAIIGLAGVTLIAGSQGSALASSVPLYTVAQAKTNKSLTQKQIKQLQDFHKQQKDIKNIQKGSKALQRMPAIKFKKSPNHPRALKFAISVQSTFLLISKDLTTTFHPRLLKLCLPHNEIEKRQKKLRA